MAVITLGSDGQSVEAYRDTINSDDSNLQDLWAAAVADGTVADDPAADDATKAARLSGVTHHRPLDGRRLCVVSTFSPLAVAIQEICGSDGVVANHFISGGAPAWVEGDDDALVSVIASNYGCPVGRPTDW